MLEAREVPTAQASWRDCAFLTVRRSAEVLGLSTASVYNLEKDGHLEFRRVSGRTLVTVASLATTVDEAEPWSPSYRGATARRASKGAAS